MPDDLDSFLTLGPEPTVDAWVVELLEESAFASITGRKPPRYKFIDELGRGGMGIVFEAWDTDLNRPVAIKRLLTTHSTELLTEAATMAQFKHEQAVEVYDLCLLNGATVIIMELVDGVDLRWWLKAQPRSWTSILDLFKQAAQVLIEAHDKNIVHCDLKPENLMVQDTEPPRIRVLDFGISKILVNHSDAELSASTGPSKTLHIAGTPQYMSSERLQGAKATIASDLFSFCVTLYECLYGHRPFRNHEGSKERLVDAIANHMIETPDRSSGVPKTLLRVLERGLHADPGARYPSMLKLLEGIEEAEHLANVGQDNPPEYVFLAHSVRDRLVVRRLAEELLRNDVRPWFTIWDLEPDDDAESTEIQQLCSAEVIVVCQGPTGWQDPSAAYRAALQAQALEPNSRIYLVNLPGAVDHGDLPVRTFRKTFDIGTSWAASVRKLAHDIGVDPMHIGWLRKEASRMNVDRRELCPYRGLEAFAETDARWMFGRGEAIEEVLNRVTGFDHDQPRFLALRGASGSGKSSLVMAGLFPLLRYGVRNERPWHLIHMRPGFAPCKMLAHELIRLKGEPENLVAASRKVTQLAKDMQREGADDCVWSYLRLAFPQERPPKVLIFVDQLEELYTQAALGRGAEGAEAQAFVRNLVYAATEPGPLHVLASLRIDFQNDFTTLPSLESIIRISTVTLRPMSNRGIQDAVELPAKRVGRTVELRLLNGILFDVAEEASRLPLLQHALRELWAASQHSRTLLHDVYVENGGLEGAIAKSAESALEQVRAKLGEEAEIIAEQIMVRLVEVGPRPTRKRVLKDDIRDARTKPILDEFVDPARVLVTNRVDDEDFYEIAHEALIQNWQRLKGWLAKISHEQLLAQDLEVAASKWKKANLKDRRRVLWNIEGALYAKPIITDQNRSPHILDSKRSLILEFLDRSISVYRLRRLGWVGGGVLGSLMAVAVLTAITIAQGRQIKDLATKNDGLETEVDAKEQQSRKASTNAKDYLNISRGLLAKVSIHEKRPRDGLIQGISAVLSYSADWGNLPREATDGLAYAILNTPHVARRPHLDLDTESDVEYLRYSYDGRRLFSSGPDGYGRVWDPATGMKVSEIEGHGDEMMRAFFSQDSQSIVSVDGVHGLKVWDAESGALVKSTGLDPRMYGPVAHSPRGPLFTTASQSGSLKLWDSATGKLVRPLGGHSGPILDMAYSEAGKLATGGRDGIASVWDMASGKRLGQFRGPRGGRVSSVAVSPDGVYVASLHGDIAYLWDARTSSRLATLEGHQEAIQSLKYSPCGTYLVTVDRSGEAVLWDVRKGAEISPIESLDGGLMPNIEFSYDGKHLAAITDEDDVKVWRTSTATLETKIVVQGARAISYAPDGETLVTASHALLQFWDPRDPVIVVKHDHTPIKSVAQDGAERQIFSLSEDGRVRVWSPITHELLADIGTRSDPVTKMVLGEGGRRLATLRSADGVATVWGLGHSGLRVRYIVPIHEISDLDISADGQRLVTVHEDEVVRSWVVGEREPSAILTSVDVQGVKFVPNGHVTLIGQGELLVADPGQLDVGPVLDRPVSVSQVEFSRDGSYLATLSVEGSVDVWQFPSGERLTSLGTGGQSTLCLLGEDASLVVTGDSDGVDVWDGKSGVSVIHLSMNPEGVQSLVCSPNRSVFATIDSNHFVQVWDGSNGDLITSFDSLEGSTVALSGDDVVVGGRDGVVRVWRRSLSGYVAEFDDAIGLRRKDVGQVEWSIPPHSLAEIGCARLRGLVGHTNGSSCGQLREGN